MDRIKGLREYVNRPEYLAELGIPKDADVQYTLLAQGEYNINYFFIHPVTGEKLILRVNTGSQMHLANQIAYEHQALKYLQLAGRTPIPRYLDASLKYLDYGIMVYLYLEGEPLDYRTDLNLAAECLADIHSVKIPKDNQLILSVNPLQEILDECRQMVQTYYQSPLGDTDKKKQIERMLQYGQKKIAETIPYAGYRCCINTELNNANFLINGPGKPNYLIDWEKPLFGDPAQDLGHFLAPTTTFWKTDIILSEDAVKKFVIQYKDAVAGRFDVDNIEDRVNLFLPINCLRGITWCAMAWVEYQQPDKLILNEFTRKKLDAYLEQEFLDLIEKQYLL